MGSEEFAGNLPSVLPQRLMMRCANRILDLPQKCAILYSLPYECAILYNQPALRQDILSTYLQGVESSRLPKTVAMPGGGLRLSQKEGGSWPSCR